MAIPPMHATLIINPETLDALRGRAGITTNAALAEAIGVDKSTVGRVLAARTEPSARFIAGLFELAAAHDIDVRDLIKTKPAA
ncbi:MAG TPA: helix-turn-helix transcriptional regulator [Actinophytocola sp.]|uniref:helix-turn-helix transcriptional regulator n=1 Tax=Actinophytocola sp. TaxID=1872138 RepID=UPI002DBE4C76|nr:helix-turn-helix transcriptional regulator [Actinophytocola sp.]HEU5475663.1 helix-turn-helix transcriptional regulator [Actinophytocola sp.]